MDQPGSPRSKSLPSGKTTPLFTGKTLWRVYELSGLKPGDILMLCLGLYFSASLSASIWSNNTGSRLQVRSQGVIVLNVPLSRDATYQVSGPLGASKITVQNHHARIFQDPSPRQYCVQQGWISHTGEIALCLPNQISMEILAEDKPYDSLGY